MLQLTEHFGVGDRTESSEQRRRRHWFIKSRHDKAREEMLDERTENKVTAFSASVIVATEIEIKAFEARLDDYDVAIVSSLVENEKQLDAVARRLLEIEDRIERALEQAYVMDDGRRVFLTEDRAQAFDEHGTEISREDLDFELVPIGGDSWESFSEYKTEQDVGFKAQGKLILEREKLFEFQEKVDNARIKLSKSEISKIELDDLDAELFDAMPASIKGRVSGFDADNNAPDVKASFGANAATVSTHVLEQVKSSPSYDPMG